MADNSTRIVITAEDKTRAAFDSVRAGLDGVGRSASTIAATIGGMAGLTGILSGAGIAAMVKESIDAADAMNDLSQRIGIAVQDLAKYELAAKQSGTSMEAIARGVKGLANSMLEHGDALKKAGVTARDADGAMRQLADLFARMPDGMEKTALAAKLFGKAGMDLIPMLNMGSKGLDESARKSERYAASMALLAPQADKFNDQMAEIALSGKMLGLTLANEVMPALTNITGAMAEAARDSGLLMAMWVGLGGVMAEFGSKAPVRDLKIVNAELEATKKIMADLAPKRGQKQGLLNDLALGTIDEQWQESNQRYATLLRERTQMENAAAASARKTASSTKTAATEANSAIAAWRKQYDEMMKALGGSSGAAKAAVDEFAAVMNRINAKDSGVDASFWKDLQTLHAGYQSGRVDADAYAEAVRNLTNQQGFAKDAAKAAAEAEESIWKAREKAREEAERGLTTLQGEIEQQQRHNEEIGLTAAGLALLTDRRMQDAIATKEQEFAKRQAEGADLAELKLIDEQIAGLEKLRQLKSDGAARQAVADAAKQSAEEWKRFTDDIERGLTDSLMRGFENGESFGKNFVKSLQNTLKTTVLKIAVQAAVSPVMSGIGQVIGGAATGSNSPLGGGINTGSSVYGGLQMFDPTLSSAGVTGSVGQGMIEIGNATGWQGLANLGVDIASGTGTAGGALSALSTAAPWIGAGLVIADAAGLFGKRGGPQSGQYGTLSSEGYSAQSTMSGGDSLGNQTLAETAYAQISSLYQMAGKKVGDLVLEQGYKLDPEGDAAGVAFRNITVDGKELTGGTFDGNNGGQWYGANNDAAGAAGYLGKLQGSEILAVVEAIGDAEFSATVAKLAANFEDLTVGLTQYTAAQATQKQLLAAMATDDERQTLMLAEAHKALDSTFAALGQTVPASAAGFRDLVGGLDLTTQAGQDTLAKLTGVSDAFLLVANAAKEAEQEQNNWRLKLDILQGKYTEQQAERFFALHGAADDATRAIMQQVYALEDQQAAASAAADAAKIAADALAELSARAASVKSSAYSAYGGLLSATGNERGALEFNVAAANEAYKDAIAAIADKVGISSAQIERNIANDGGVASAVAKTWRELGDAQDADTLDSRELLTRLMNAASGVAQAQNALKVFNDQAAISVDTVSQVADDQARAQQQIRDEWQRTADSIFDTIRKLRGEMLGDKLGYAKAQTDYTIALAQARAGSQDAANRLPEMATALVDLGKLNTATATEQALLTARTLAGLQDVVKNIGSTFGVTIPAFAVGTNRVPQDMLAMVHKDEAIIPAAFNPWARGANGGNDDLIAEVRALRAEVAELRAANSAENRAIASATTKTAKTLERFDDADALTVRVTA